MAMLVAVYHSEHDADAVHDALVEHGVDDQEIRVGVPADDLRSEIAEMEAEVSAGWGSGLFGLMTNEMVRGALAFAVIGMIIGAIVGLVLGLVLFDAASSTWVRVGAGAALGAPFGVAVGALLGGGLAMQSPAEPLAAEHGVTVAVDHVMRRDAVKEIEQVLTEFHPVRVDELIGAERVRTGATEEPSGVAETLEQFRANTRDPRRQG